MRRCLFLGLHRQDANHVRLHRKRRYEQNLPAQASCPGLDGVHLSEERLGEGLQNADQPTAQDVGRQSEVLVPRVRLQAQGEVRPDEDRDAGLLFRQDAAFLGLPRTGYCRGVAPLDAERKLNAVRLDAGLLDAPEWAVPEMWSSLHEEWPLRARAKQPTV